MLKRNGINFHFPISNMIVTMIVTMIVVSRSAPAMERRLRFDVGHIGGLYRRLSSTEGA